MSTAEQEHRQWSIETLRRDSWWAFGPALLNLFGVVVFHFGDLYKADEPISWFPPLLMIGLFVGYFVRGVWLRFRANRIEGEWLAENDCPIPPPKPRPSTHGGTP